MPPGSAGTTTGQTVPQAQPVHDRKQMAHSSQPAFRDVRQLPFWRAPAQMGGMQRLPQTQSPTPNRLGPSARKPQALSDRPGGRPQLCPVSVAAGPQVLHSWSRRWPPRPPQPMGQSSRHPPRWTTPGAPTSLLEWSLGVPPPLRASTSWHQNGLVGPPTAVHHPGTN